MNINTLAHLIERLITYKVSDADFFHLDNYVEQYKKSDVPKKSRDILAQLLKQMEKYIKTQKEFKELTEKQLIGLFQSQLFKEYDFSKVQQIEYFMIMLSNSITKTSFQQIIDFWIKHFPMHNNISYEKPFFFHMNKVLIYSLGTHKNMSAFEEFTSILKEIQKNIDKDATQLFYRGHDNINYKAIPSLFRENSWINHEDYMYNQLIMRKTTEFEKCNTNFQRLSKMQHYTLPTRLLDITTNPLVALYFACQNPKKFDGSIILFEEQEKQIRYAHSDSVRIISSLCRLNYLEKNQIFDKIYSSPSKVPQQLFDKLASEIAYEKSGFTNKINPNSLKQVYIVRANYDNNERIARQAGLFIICTHPKYHDQQIDKIFHKQNGCKVIIHIPKNLKKELLELLDIFDFNRATLYTGMDDVSQYIKEMTHKML